MNTDNQPNNEFLIHFTETKFRQVIFEEFQRFYLALNANKTKDISLELMTMADITTKFKNDKQTVTAWIKHSEFPKPIKKIGKAHYWLKSDIEAYVISKNENIK